MGKLGPFCKLTVVLIDLSKVFFEVTGRNDLLRTYNGFVDVVEGIELNGNATLQGNKVESFFPLFVERTRPFGGDGYVYVVVVAHIFRQAVGNFLLVAAVNGDAVEMTQQDA